MLLERDTVLADREGILEGEGELVKRQGAYPQAQAARGFVTQRSEAKTVEE
jgi:hypothetical protein